MTFQRSLILAAHFRFRIAFVVSAAATSSSTRTRGSSGPSIAASTAAAPQGSISRIWRRTRGNITITDPCPRSQAPSPPRPSRRQRRGLKVRAVDGESFKSKRWTDFSYEQKERKKTSLLFPGNREGKVEISAK